MKKRIYYLDILRAFACLVVIMLHTSCVYVLNYRGDANYLVGNIFDALSRTGVALFIMISGALLLDQKYVYSKEKLFKHIKRFIIFFIFWSSVYCVAFNVLGQLLLEHKDFNIYRIITALIDGYYHMWYIYLIIGLYLIVPILRLWIKDENKKYIEYFLLLSLIFTFVLPTIGKICSYYDNPVVNIISNLTGKISIEYLGCFVSYFILGWYIHNYGFNKKKLIYIFGIIGLVASFAGTYIISNSINGRIQLYYDSSLFTLLEAAAVFLFVKNIFSDKKENKLICFISKYSLGIYALHPMFIDVMYKVIDKFDFNIAIINIPVVFIISFTASIIVSFIMSKIPKIKDLV